MALLGGGNNRYCTVCKQAVFIVDTSKCPVCERKKNFRNVRVYCHGCMSNTWINPEDINKPCPGFENYCGIVGKIKFYTIFCEKCQKEIMPIVGKNKRQTCPDCLTWFMGLKEDLWLENEKKRKEEDGGGK